MSKRAQLEVGGKILPFTPTLLGQVWYGSGAGLSELNGSKSSQKYSRTSFLWHGGGGAEGSSAAVSAPFCLPPEQATASHSAEIPSDTANPLAQRALLEKPMTDSLL